MDKFKQYLQQKAEELDDDIPSQRVWNEISNNLNQSKTELIPETSISKKGVIFKITKWSVAACILVLAGIGGWDLVKNKKINEPSIVETKTINNSDSEINITAIEKTTEIDTPFSRVNFVRGIEKEVVKNTEQKNKIVTPKATYTSPLTSLQKDEINSVENNFNTVITLAKNKIANTPIYGENPSFYSDFIDKFKQMESDEKIVKKEIIQLGLSDMLLEQLINIYQQKLNVLKLLQSEINKTNIRFKQNRNAVDTLRANYIEI